MLTIGELASYAGVTVRAVRHYHAKGLLPEPERDHSGYRRYDAGAVIELIRIRTLAQAGVPLTRVRELLRAGEEEFAAAVADIDERLRDEIRQRQRHRERIARLAAGDRLALPSEVVEYLDRLRALGVAERMVEAERDGWILLAAHSPGRVTEWMARKREQIADPQLIDFYRTVGQALDQTADDPRLVELADELAAYITRMAAEQGEDYVDDTDMEPPLVKLMDARAFDTVPAARRLIELMRKRGWTGWTKLERVTPGRRALPPTGRTMPTSGALEHGLRAPNGVGAPPPGPGGCPAPGGGSAASEHLGGEDVAAESPAAVGDLVDEDQGRRPGALAVHVGVGVGDGVDELLLGLGREGVGGDLEVGERHDGFLSLGD